VADPESDPWSCLSSPGRRRVGPTPPVHKPKIEVLLGSPSHFVGKFTLLIQAVPVPRARHAKRLILSERHDPGTHDSDLTP
jgi:hypothetical protein